MHEMALAKRVPPWRAVAGGSLALVAVILGACNCGQKQPQAESHGPAPSPTPTLGRRVTELGAHLDAVFQDAQGRYWIGSNGEGVYFYDGGAILNIREADGLCSDYVLQIQADIHGDLWFTTRNGVCRYDGQAFTDATAALAQAPYGDVRYAPGALFFGHRDGIAVYDGVAFSNFILHPKYQAIDPADENRPYGLYASLIDAEGRAWFGTQEKGVAVYDGGALSYLTDKDLAGPAVRAIYQDRRGVLWFGNNGGGLYRYDGRTLRNITEEHGLGNEVFLRQRKPVGKPGSLARVFAINEDLAGNLWIGTVDAGVWRYDGTTLTNFTAKDGIAGNAVATMFRDRTGELWFIADGAAILRFDGAAFVPVSFAVR